MLMAFLPQFRQSFNDLPDEELDKILHTIKQHLDYIENGTVIE